MFQVVLATRITLLLFDGGSGTSLSESLEGLQYDKIIVQSKALEHSTPLKQSEYLSYIKVQPDENPIIVGLNAVATEYVLLVDPNWVVDTNRFERALELMERSSASAVSLGLEPTYYMDTDAAGAEMVRLDPRRRALAGVWGVVWWTSRLWSMLDALPQFALPSELQTAALAWGYQALYGGVLESSVPCLFRPPGLPAPSVFGEANAVSVLEGFSRLEAFLSGLEADSSDAFQRKRALQKARGFLLDAVGALLRQGGDFLEFQELWRRCEAVFEASSLKVEEKKTLLDEHCATFFPTGSGKSEQDPNLPRDNPALSIILPLQKLTYVSFLREFARQDAQDSELLIVFSAMQVGQNAAVALRNYADLTENVRAIALEDEGVEKEGQKPATLETLLRTGVRNARGSYLLFPRQTTGFASLSALYFLERKLRQHIASQAASVPLKFATQERRISQAEALANPAPEAPAWHLPNLCVPTRLAKMGLRQMKYDLKFQHTDPRTEELAFSLGLIRAAAQEISGETPREIQAETLVENVIWNEAEATEIVLHDVGKITRLCTDNQASEHEAEHLAALFAHQAKLHLWAAQQHPDIFTKLQDELLRQGVHIER